MTALHNQRGTALVAALSISMILLPLGALVALQCRTDLAIQYNLRNDVETFYVAEAGLAHAVAEIGPGQSFAQLLAGPDHVKGTADDGAFPFAEGAPSAFPYPPFRYDVQVVPSGSSMLRIVSHATGAHGSTKVLDTLVTRAPLPFAPSALYTETTNTNLVLADGFRLSGIDHQVLFPPVPETAPATPLPALSTSRADAEPMLREAISGAPAGQISGAAAGVATVTPLDLGTYANSIINTPGAITCSAAPVGDAQWGTPQAPQLSIVAGDLDVRGRLAGSGVLLVRGALHVAGIVEFSGVILVQGAILFEPSSTTTVVGTLWQAPSQDERLELRGSGIVAYSSNALSTIDHAFPALLPHAVVVAGWQEEL